MEKRTLKTNALILFLVCMMPLCVFAQQLEIPQKEMFHHNKSFEDEFGYVQAMKVNNTIYISGIAAKGSMETALLKVYERAEKILAYYNCTLSHIVKETIYTTQFDALIENKDIRKNFYKGNFPTSTWVQVQRLYSPEAVIEIEFMAVSGDSKRIRRK
jgi:2-iminobutanoate/2-iminopropanoate deaminase